MKRILINILIPAFLPGLGFSQSDQNLIYTSFLGGSDFDFVSYIADGSNSDFSVLCGCSESEDFPLEGDSYQSFFGGGLTESFYAKMDSEGQIYYSTFFGGNGGDCAESCQVTQNGEIIIGGGTRSDDFPIQNGHNELFDGFEAGWLARFNESDDLVWSTYIKGDGDFDIIRDLDVDQSDNIFFCGTTTSSDLSTEGVYQEEVLNTDVFSGIVAKYGPDGNPVWVSYFADEELVVLESIALSPDGSVVYVQGWTDRTDPFTGPVYQAENNGSSDAILLAFSAEDGTLSWGTYFGGESFETAQDIAVHDDGTIFITGYTASLNDISTPGSFQETSNGNEDFYLASFSPDGLLIWSTYIGGSDIELFGSNVLVKDDHLIFGANVKSEDMEIVGMAFSPVVQEEFIDPSVGYLSKFTLDGEVIWSTYSNPNYECGSCWRLSQLSDGRILCTGSYGDQAASSECEETISEDAYQPEFGGGSADAAIFILEDNVLSATSRSEILPLKIFPNPSSSHVIIEVPGVPSEIPELSIINLSGQVIDRITGFRSGSGYSISNLDAGVYFVTGRIGENIFRQKLVVYN